MNRVYKVHVDNGYEIASKGGRYKSILGQELSLCMARVLDWVRMKTESSMPIWWALGVLEVRKLLGIDGSVPCAFG